MQRLAPQDEPGQDSFVVARRCGSFACREQLRRRRAPRPMDLPLGLPYNARVVGLLLSVRHTLGRSSRGAPVLFRE